MCSERSQVITGLVSICLVLLNVDMIDAQRRLPNQLEQDESLYGVSFTSAETGTAVGEQGLIARTTDGGQGWSVQVSGTINALYGVWFTSVNTGTAVGGGGTILRTTTGGATWTSQWSGTTRRLNNVCFTDDNTGTVVGAGGLILRTTDGGTTWNAQSIGTSRDLWGVSFSDATTGTVVGNVGTILRTTDGGAVWASQTSGTTYLLYDVCFTDANTGAAVGAQQTILHTTDGGSTWTEQYTKPGTGVYFHAVWFTDSDIGTVVGDLGKILRTADGGTTWGSQLSGTTKNLYDVSFTDSYTGNVVGADGTILRTTDGGSTWTAEGPVPIQLANLSAAITADNHVLLLWSTLSEINNYGFEVQRAQSTPQEYITLPHSFVPGHGTTLEPFEYSFVDDKPPLGRQLWYRLKQMDLDGRISYFGEVSIEVVTAIKDELIPAAFELNQNYPNPFNPATKIQFTIDNRQLTIVKVYDVLGRDVATLVNEVKQPGTYTVDFSGSGLAGGLYFYRLTAGNFISTKKMLLLQ